jgi:DNA-directed RNA polymerase I, II, and III subunit RPABC1
MDKQAISVLSEMINDRGYKIDYVINDTSTLSSVDDNLNEEFPFCIRGKKHIQDGSDDVILCFLSTEEKLTIQGIKDRISIMNREGSKRCIIVYQTSVTSSAKKSLETLEYNFELFALYELQLNITKHRLVPIHQLATESEKEELDKHYKGKLPTLLHTDAICRYYAFQRGDYIRITRKNGTVIYRIVK